MAKKSNKTAIGFFVVGAVALAIAAILILGSGRLFRDTVKAVCYFDGSIGGLNIGAPVVFRGVKVGSVTDILLRYDTKKLAFSIPVFIEFDPAKFEAVGPVPEKLGQNMKAFIDMGMRAQLEMQSFVTGQMMIGVDLHPEKPATFAGGETRYPEIPTIHTPFQELTKKVEQIPIDQMIKDIQSTLKGIEKMVNSPDIAKTLANVALTSEEVRGLVKNVNSQVLPLAGRANVAVDEIKNSVHDVSSQVATLVASAGDAVKDGRRLLQNIDGEVKPLSSSVQGTLAEAQTFLQDGRKLVGNIDGQIKPLVASIEEKMKDMQRLVRNVDGKVDQLGPAISKTLETAGATLQDAQGTLRTIGGAAGEDSPFIYELKEAFRELSAAARSLWALADSLDRTPEALIRGKK